MGNVYWKIKGKYMKFESMSWVENEIYLSKLLFFSNQYSFFFIILLNEICKINWRFISIIRWSLNNVFREDAIRQIDFSLFTIHVF